MSNRKYNPPRSTFWGGPPRHGEQGTWLEPECDGERRARVVFPDGKLRIVRCSGVADTFFSIACRGRHRGYVSCDDGVFKFNAYTG